jgi:hypothetical protein
VGAAPSANRLSDVLLACQAREFGWTIVTRDADFAAIRRSVTGLKVAAPFPARRMDRRAAVSRRLLPTATLW